MTDQLSLYSVIDSRGALELTPDQYDQILSIFGFRCREETKNRMSRILRHPSIMPNYGIYRRVLLRDHGAVSYCAGQDYTAEIKTVRDLILNRGG